MGHKVNPKALRLGYQQTWPSHWFAKKDYSGLLREDLLIRKFLKSKLKEAVIDLIEIERTPAQIVITITAARPGIIIGRGGQGIEEVKKEISRKFLSKTKQNVKLNIQELPDPNLSAAAILFFLIQDIEKRMPFRRVMKQSLERVMKAGALGVKVRMSGRLNGVEIARTETLGQGKVPLHTLRANIDYSRGAAQTTYGIIGVKVWIYKGEIFDKKESVNKPSGDKPAVVAVKARSRYRPSSRQI